MTQAFIKHGMRTPCAQLHEIWIMLRCMLGGGGEIWIILGHGLGGSGEPHISLSNIFFQQTVTASIIFKFHSHYHELIEHPPMFLGTKAFIS